MLSPNHILRITESEVTECLQGLRVHPLGSFGILWHPLTSLDIHWNPLASFAILSVWPDGSRKAASPFKLNDLSFS